MKDRANYNKEIKSISSGILFLFTPNLKTLLFTFLLFLNPKKKREF